MVLRAEVRGAHMKRILVGLVTAALLIFPASYTSRDGRSSWCRDDHNQTNRQWRARKKAEFLAERGASA
jgi:hypothetical protein